MTEKLKAYEADSGELELDMGDHEEAEVELQDTVEEAAEQEAGQEAETAEADAADGSNEELSEQEELTNSAQKRINRLTKKMRDAERQREEAIRYAQQVYQEAEKLKSRMKQLDSGYLQEYGSRLELETKTAEAALKRAVEVGDSDTIIASQRRLNELYSAAQKYRDAKRMQETREQEYAAQQQQAPQNYAEQEQYIPPQQEVRRPDKKAEEWAERNPWFGEDEGLTFAAFGVHKRLVEEEGFDPQTDEYYTELDRRMKHRFGNLMKPAEDSAENSGNGRRPAQTVAGVSRANGKASGRKKVRLTPTQVAIAKKLGVPLEEYAKYVKE